MIGAWTYDDGKSKYSVVHDGSRLLFHEEDVGDGFLVADKDGWRVANLKEGAQTIGMIRLKLVDEEMISHFKADGKDQWGSQTRAQRLSTAVEIQVLLPVVAVPNEIRWRVCNQIRLYIPHCCSDTVRVAHSHSGCLSVSHCCLPLCMMPCYDVIKGTQDLKICFACSFSP